MFPTINIFGKTFTTYLILSLIAAFAAGMFACKLTKKRGEDDNEAIIVMLFSTIGIFIGGHLLYGITNIKNIPSLFVAENFHQFLDRAYFIFGGSVFYGGLIGAIIAALITIKVRNLPLRVYSDILSVAIPLFHSIARVGCFLSGCCYGIESEFGFTVYNNTLVPSINGVSRFPVQLLEACLNLLIFFMLLIIYKKSLSYQFLQGKLIFIYLFSYSVVRFFVEFLRGDEIRGFIFGISTSQFISILLFILSAVTLSALFIKEKRKQTVKA